MKIFIAIVLVAVVATLASAGVFMLRRRDPQDQGADLRMARALALRVALSIGLFLMLLLAWLAGWIHPTGIPAGG